MSNPLRAAVPLALIIGALCYGIWHYHSDAGRLRQELQANKLQHQQEIQRSHQEMQDALAAQNQQHQRALASLQAEQEKRLSDMRNQQNQQMNLAIKEFESIFAGNKRSLEHLDEVEAALSKGKALSAEELQRLNAIVGGIGFLRSQYRKPLQDFTALQNYFEEATRRAASSSQKPETNFGFFKRMFSREFREAEREALREEGAKRAFTEASSRFEEVYQVAQKSMNSIDLDVASLQGKLQALADDRQKASTAELDSALKKIREALTTHQKVLEFSPPAETPKVQP